MFQFKINHHILYTCDQRFKAKITDSDSCNVCELKQTVERMFVEGQHVHSFWNLFTSWWNDNNSPSVSLINNDKIYEYHGRQKQILQENITDSYDQCSNFGATCFSVLMN